MSKTVKKKQKSGWRWTDLYQDIQVMNHYSMPDIVVKRFAEDLVEWAKSDPTAIRVQQFLAERDVSYDVYVNWKRDYPLIKRADDQARMIIANRRELNAATRQWSEAAALRMMHWYDPEWQKEIDNKRAHERAMKFPEMDKEDIKPFQATVYRDSQGNLQLVELPNATHESRTERSGD